MSKYNHYEFGKSFVKASSSLQNIFSDLSSALYSNKEHNLNANLLEKYGENALLRGAEAERNYRLSEKMILGKQKNILAQNGVDLSSKTAIDILTQTERNIENDALQIRANAQEEKRQLDLQAAQNRIQGYLNKRSGQNAIFSGFSNSALALLSGSYKAGYWE